MRKQGHALSLGLVTLGAGVVAMPLPKVVDSHEPLAVSVTELTNALVSQERKFADRR